jgi:hypothetical protein
MAHRIGVIRRGLLETLQTEWGWAEISRFFSLPGV